MANRNRCRLSGFFLQTHATDSQQRDSADPELMIRHCQRKIPDTRTGYGIPWVSPEKSGEINNGEL
jgi:hypothetical protein